MYFAAMLQHHLPTSIPPARYVRTVCADSSDGMMAVGALHVSPDSRRAAWRRQIAEVLLSGTCCLPEVCARFSGSEKSCRLIIDEFYDLGFVAKYHDGRGRRVIVVTDRTALAHFVGVEP